MSNENLLQIEERISRTKSNRKTSHGRCLGKSSNNQNHVANHFHPETSFQFYRRLDMLTKVRKIKFITGEDEETSSIVNFCWQPTLGISHGSHKMKVYGWWENSSRAIHFTAEHTSHGKISHHKSFVGVSVTFMNVNLNLLFYRRFTSQSVGGVELRW